MARPALEVADIFRTHGPAWRRTQAGHLSLGQLKVMSAIERCRTAALGGHVARCEACDHIDIAYNSCRNRHCPKCQGAAAKAWLADREAELLPVPYYHVVFTLPAPIADIAYQNKAAIYAILFKAIGWTLLRSPGPIRLSHRNDVGVKMRQKPSTHKSPSEKLVKDIRRATRKHYSAEDKIRIVLDGLRGESSIAELCRREGIAESLYYSWSKEFLEAGKRRLAGVFARSLPRQHPYSFG